MGTSSADSGMSFTSSDLALLDDDRSGGRSNIDLRVLRYFLAVADEGNITWAAELLRISQPTLSRQLKGLEDALGVTLFHRGPHQISLTPEGRLLRERAQELVQLADKMEREVRELHGSLSGIIAIGCAETHSMDWLARCIAAFRRRYPEVEFEVRTCTADVTGDRLEQGLADLGLVTEPLDVSKYDYLRTHIDDRWGVLMRADDPLAELDEIRPDDLDGRALILPFREEVRSELISWMGGSLRSVAVAGLCDLSINVMTMVRGGVGLAMSFGLGVAEDLRFKPLNPVLESGGAVIWKRGRTLNPAAAAFVEFLRTEGRHIAC
ncbi:LysR family transcriptional regulator [Bifidobacterium pullorum]|uniref:LysR family transcriptional regulator n=1 Tax=Bifidobacterium pullorum TaxID=78448 RepID=UPI00242BACB7|nr:LysR family transcriptional regulator [Bifidobacterium pullorum]